MMTATDLFFELADGMTIPAEGEHSASDWIFSVVDELRDLPHVGKLKEITALWTLLKDQEKQKLSPAQEALCLPSAFLNARRLAAKWKKAKVRLLFEPLSVLDDLISTFIYIRKSFLQLQVSSKDCFADQLDKVIDDLTEGGAYKELKSAETEFKQLFSRFLHEKRSKPDTSEDVISVGTWLGQQLGTDAASIRQELVEMEEYEGSFFEELLLYVAELEERKCTPDGSVSSDADSEVDGFDKPLEDVAQDAVLALRLPQMPRVLMGIDNLIACIKLKGKREVVKANAISEAIRLAEEKNEPYLSKAMALLKELSYPCDAGKVGMRVNQEICLHISDHLNFLIYLMKDRKHPEARLLAAETVVNMLVVTQIWETVRSQHDIVSALVAISFEKTLNQNNRDVNRRDRVCLVGLRRLKDPSLKSLEGKPGGDKFLIVTALMQLLRVGLDDAVLRNLARDTLVALDTQVLSLDHRTPSMEVCLHVRSDLLSLMGTHGFMSHSTVRGRTAIISLMTKLCESYVGEGISEALLLYLLKVLQTTRSEIRELLDDQRSDLKKLLQLSVKLLWFCVTHGKDTAQAVLTKNVEEWKLLEGILEEDHSGDLGDTKLEILEIFDHIDPHNSSQGPTAVGEVAVLVKMAKSQSPACRVKVANRFRKFAVDNLDENEMQEAGGVKALMDLLRDEIVDCRVAALLALHHLSQRIAIQAKELPLQTILAFLQLKWPSDVRVAAVWFLCLMVKENAAGNAKKFMEAPEALKAMLHCFDRDAENPVSQTCASALLSMATVEDVDDVRVGVAYADLSVLVKFVLYHATEHKELLTTMLALLCRHATVFEEALINAEGHKFMLKSLQENFAKRAAAQGLLILIRNPRTQGDVLHAGFVEIAMGSVDQELASTEVALALADICSIRAELKKIVACPRSVGALLQLLDVCPTTEGKAAAAAVIAALLNEDSTLQDEMTAACPHLITYIGKEDQQSQDQQSRVKEFLKALAVFAKGSKGRERIHEERGEERLMLFLRSTKDTEVRDLVLQILAEMSNGFPERTSGGQSIHPKILKVFSDNNIGELLCQLLCDVDFRKSPESMKNVLILIKNLSLPGSRAYAHLSENGVVPLLLNALRDHGSSLSPVTELAVRALLKFVDDPNEKKLFLPGEVIKLLVAVLKLKPKSSDAILILASVAQDPKNGKGVCEAMFNDILPALTSIMNENDNRKSKWQAATLAKLLVQNGPTQKVCDAMCKAGTVEAVQRLCSVTHCDKVAEEIIKILKGQKGDCRKRIDAILRSPSPR